MRAVGLANGANPIGIVVPCHRVIGSDGSLTGYGGGLERKRWLLAHEARNAGEGSVSQKVRRHARAERQGQFPPCMPVPKLLILPNAWDAGSARVIESAGAKAIATSSAAVAWAHGYPDGQFLPFDTLLATLRGNRSYRAGPGFGGYRSRLCSGRGRSTKRSARIVDAGAVGVNIEDGNDPPDLLCPKIEHAKAAAAQAGVDLWVNARIDVYLRKLVPGRAAFDETVRRARLYREAGADSIFVPAWSMTRRIARLVTLLSGCRSMLSAWPGLPDGATPSERLACAG